MQNIHIFWNPSNFLEKKNFSCFKNTISAEKKWMLVFLRMWKRLNLLNCLFPSTILLIRKKWRKFPPTHENWKDSSSHSPPPPPPCHSNYTRLIHLNYISFIRRGGGGGAKREEKRDRGGRWERIEKINKFR